MRRAEVVSLISGCQSSSLLTQLPHFCRHHLFTKKMLSDNMAEMLVLNFSLGHISSRGQLRHLVMQHVQRPLEVLPQLDVLPPLHVLRPLDMVPPVRLCGLVSGPHSCAKK